MTWRHWLSACLPLATLLGAVVTVWLSLDRIATEASSIEETLTVRSAEAAVKSYLRHLGESHADYAVWDDAVRALYGTVDQEFADQNFLASTAAPTLYETAYLVDENGEDVFAFRNGKPAALSSQLAFGAAGTALAAKVPTDGRAYDVATGIVRTPWGLEAVAVGPVVPNTAAITDPPRRARLLILAKVLDDTATARIAQDYVIDGLRLADAAETQGIVLTDPTGTAVGRLAWGASGLGSQARANVEPIVFIVFGLLAISVGGMSLLTIRSFRRGEQMAIESLTQQQRLEGALASVSHGICMFDAGKRLVFCNTSYARMYNLSPELTVAGTPLQTIFDYRKSIGNAPADFPNYVSHLGIDWITGGTKVFDFVLEDGRTIRINHLNMEGGSYIASHEDMTAVAGAENRLNQVARQDVLTGLANRIGFRENLGAALGAAAAGDRLAVLCLDLDGFKAINDTLGHETGDALLVAIAERLRGVTGDRDQIARLGGDAFAVVQVDQQQPDGAKRLAQAIMDALRRPYYDLLGNETAVDVSVGVALAPDHGDDAEHLQKNAETALYWVKSHGRGTSTFFDPAMNAEARSHHLIATGLRHAIEREELEVRYQPIFHLDSNSLVGFEALLRWRHPQLGFISPADFIPVAEETGLIVGIGAWVLRRACADAALWPGDLRVAVNLSSVQFKDAHLATTVFSALAGARLPARRLELEITESVLLNENPATLATLHQLRDFGVGISMDDFGTGYSSLSYLRSFPFDKIKIDQSFVRDIATSADARAIVRAVVGLGTEFGLSTVAEGVETAEQLSLLRAAGCTLVQGYLFSEARPVAELAEFFVKAKPPKSVAA